MRPGSHAHISHFERHVLVIVPRSRLASGSGGQTTKFPFRPLERSIAYSAPFRKICHTSGRGGDSSSCSSVNLDFFPLFL